MVVVLSSTPYNALLEKVTKKIRLCSGKQVDQVRMRYIDEDGDAVLISDDDDVQMAFEARTDAGEVELVVG